MDLQLAGKVVLITGGSKGIGRGCAEAFAREGCKVAIVSRDAENLKKAEAMLAEKGVKVISIVADLGKPEEAVRAVAEAERQLGPIDVLINSAGAAKHHPLHELSVEAWHQGMDAKYFTYIHVMQAVLPAMAKRKRGAVVNIIGMGGKIGRPHHLAGGAANAALMLVSTGLASGYAPEGVRINAISPGGTITERSLARLQVESRKTGRTIEELQAEAAKDIPLRRLGLPEDIAHAALFLASDRASYITGVCIPMDGGSLPVI